MHKRRKSNETITNAAKSKGSRLSSPSFDKQFSNLAVPSKMPTQETRRMKLNVIDEPKIISRPSHQDLESRQGLTVTNKSLSLRDKAHKPFRAKAGVSTPNHASGLKLTSKLFTHTTGALSPSSSFRITGGIMSPSHKSVLSSSPTSIKRDGVIKHYQPTV